MNPKLFATTIIAMLLMSSFAFAVPGVPNQIYGSVSINGNSAPDGTTVTARINNVEVASTATQGGNYNFYVDDPNSVRSGQEIVMFVNGVNTGISTYFVNYGVTRLDLSVTIETATGGGAAGGGGGSSSSTGTTTTSTQSDAQAATQIDQACQERWTCSEWGACVDGVQTRTCTDENDCGTNSREPFASQPCNTVEAAAADVNPTGFFILTPSNMIIASLIAGGAVVVALLVVLMRRTKPAPLTVASY